MGSNTATMIKPDTNSVEIINNLGNCMLQDLKIIVDTDAHFTGSLLDAVWMA